MLVILEGAGVFAEILVNVTGAKDQKLRVVVESDQSISGLLWVSLVRSKDGKRVKEAFLANGFHWESQSLAERIADKMNFTIGNYCSAEAHCARMGEFGEHTDLSRYILDHKVRLDLDGADSRRVA